MIDLWDTLHDLFDFTLGDDDFPEIDVISVTPAQLQSCMQFFILQSRELNTAFFLSDTREQVMVPSLDAATQALAEGFIIGAVSLELPCVPALGVFVRSPGGFSLSYEPGAHWNALMLSGLFELLREIQLRAPMSIFQLNRNHFTRKQRRLFEVTLKDYLNEKV